METNHAEVDSCGGHGRLIRIVRSLVHGLDSGKDAHQMKKGVNSKDEVG
jgi:hypothetical protein